MDFREGLQLPSLTKYIKGILEQYPDDGNILKELLQNADDAGATTVRFLLDESTYQSDSGELIHPELSKFQGPALLVYNDAVFTEEDWNGICMMQESIKREDVIKTGRFGLGFKSIFHLTDMPTIFSGDYIGIIDPHKEYLPNGRSAYNWHLSSDSSFIKQKEKQFEPLFHELFETNSDVLLNGTPFTHTVFRFPLRNKASILSNTCYNKEKVLQLFHSLELDQGKSLLFLKSIRCIEVYQKSGIREEPDLICSMKIAGRTAEEVFQKREIFLNGIRQRAFMKSPVETLYEMTVVVEQRHENGKSVTRQDWLVFHTCQGKKEVLDVAQELKVLPWVGIALPLSNSENNGMSYSDPAGQLFATLPLPLDGTERTGLEFHIHGYFAMEQNRRHLRWPTEDQDQYKHSLQLTWNQLLINNSIPTAVVSFFKRCVALKIQPCDLYKLMPDSSVVDVKWKPIVSRIYKELFKGPSLHSNVNEGCWIKPEEGRLLDEQLPSRVREMVEQILIAAEIPVVSPPLHVTVALGDHSSGLCTTSGKTLHDAILKLVQKGQLNLEKEDALKLLQYILEHGQPKDLLDLPLMPLLSGEMATFKRSKDAVPIFMTSKDHPMSLLPGLENRIIQADLEPQIENLLLKLAHKGFTQVKPLSFKDVLQNLQNVLPKAWMDQDIVTWCPEEEPNHPRREWLEQIWDYINFNNPKAKDWQVLDKLHLLPVDDCNTLCRFCVGKKILLRERREKTLPVGICSFLSDIGVIILSELPEFVQRNKELVYHSVHSPSCDEILDVMMSMQSELGTSFFEKVKIVGAENCRYLKDFLTYISDSGINLLSKKKKKFLREIPLFSTVMGSGFQPARNVSLQEVPFSGPSMSLPVPFPVQVIDVTDKKILYLLESIEIKRYHQYPFSKVLVDVLLPAITSGKYSETQLDDLLCYIMDHHRNLILNNEMVVSKLCHLNFVETTNGERSSPSDVYDPQDPLLALFLQESLFPHQKYRTKDRLACLAKLGMNLVTGVSRKLFLSIAHSLHTEPNKSAEFLKLATILSEEVPDVKWWESLKDVAFLTAVQGKPTDYPDSLPWKGLTKHLLRPKDVCHIKYAKQVGCIVPLVDLDERTLTALEAKTVPTIEDIVNQLKLIIENYNLKEKNRYLLLLDEVYSSLSYFTKNEIKSALNQCSISSWVWSGKDFQPPGKVVLKDMNIDLTPYIYTVPAEMQKHQKLMQKCGVQPNVQLTRILKIIATKHEKNDPDIVQDVSNDLQLAINIVVRLCREGIENPLVPIEMKTAAKLCFKTASECSIWDGVGEVDDEFFLVHRAVPQEVLDYLDIPSVMHRVLDGEEFNIDLESFGQTEPLTTRLRSILEGYTDGLSVLKEMIQNSDDAGATEVKMIYDMRENKDHRHSLIDPGMAAWQGPAIWIYNDAVFTQEDFTSITRLNGATKAYKQDEIGAFGLGFNAVYNLTDVPSILSGDTLAVFDPHTTYLGKAVRDKSKPGLRINIGKAQGKVLSKYPDQFAPWTGVCGCNFDPNSKDSKFNGTLFRLPLRGKKEGCFSEICNIVYDDSNVADLLKMIHSKGQNMLLFSQNVVEVSVSLIPKDAKTLQLETKNLFEIRKEPVEYLRKHGFQCDLSNTCRTKNAETQIFINECSILKAAKQMRKETREIDSSMVISTVLETSEEALKILDDAVSPSRTETHWIVSQCIKDMAPVVEITKPAIAGIALALDGEHGQYRLHGAETGAGDPGSYFSFLPLPVKCPLPFCINGTFILDQSRRHLVQKTDHDRTSIGGSWNKGLMEGAVCQAYKTLLSDLITLIGPDEDVTKILPYNKEEDLITFFSEAFWAKEIQDFESPRIFSCPGGRVSLHHAYFLESNFMDSLTEEGKVAAINLISSELSLRNMRLVNLSTDLRNTLTAVDTRLLRSRTITEEIFFMKYFYPNTKSLALKQRERDYLFVQGLKLKSEAISHALKNWILVPVSPDGKQMAPLHNLIHPYGRAAVLYCPEDSRFPSFQGVNHEDRKFAYERLAQVGMVCDNLQWTDIVERASCIAKIGPRSYIGLVNCFLSYLSWKIVMEKGIIPPDVHKNLRTERFLPAVAKPDDWSLKWKGDAGAYCGVELCSLKEPLLASTQTPVLHEEVRISRDVAKVLGIKMDDSVKLETLKMQLLEIAINRDSLQASSVQKSLTKIYRRLNKECEDAGRAEHVRMMFSDEQFIEVGGYFVSPRTCAFRVDFDGFPFMNQIPKTHEKLMRAVGIKEQFSCSDYVISLARIKHAYGNNPGPAIVRDIIAGLCKLLRESKKTIRDLSGETPLFIPDVSGVLQAADALCYHDEELNIELEFPIAHMCITKDIGEVLGVKDARTHALYARRNTVPSQNEDGFIEDINSSLDLNPFGVQTLLELVQEADTSGSKTLHFTLDLQSHKQTTVFNDGWKAMQGPSLLVYFDVKFELGKLMDMFHLRNDTKGERRCCKAGWLQNIYHLSDTPTVLATLKDGSEILIVCDPAGAYIQGTSPDQPGIVYSDLPVLRKLFPDVFNCYPRTKGTAFRFPLRTQTATQKSEIKSSRVVTEIDGILTKFAEQSYQALLFLTSLRKVAVTRIDPHLGTRDTQEIVSSILTESSEQEVEDFRKHVLVEKQKCLENNGASHPNFRRVSYSLTLKGLNEIEEWSVVQQCGLKPSLNTQQNDTRRCGGMKTLDAAVGAAAVLEKVNGKVHYFRPKSLQSSEWALLMDSDSPVRVKGQFKVNPAKKPVLSQEDSVEIDWNNFICKVVAAAYFALVIRIKKTVNGSSVQRYFKVFPISYNASCDQQVDATDYKAIRSLIPQELYRNLSTEEIVPQTTSENSDMKWSKPCDACFVKPLDKYNSFLLQDSALKGAQLCGLYISKCPDSVQAMLTKYCKLQYFSPGTVMDFLRSDECCTSKLSEMIEKELQDEVRHGRRGFDTVKKMLKFCQMDDAFEDSLDDLPLMVTSDGKLNVFDQDDPVYKTDKMDLLSPDSKEFLHKELVEFFSEIESPVFKELDVEGLCGEAAKLLPEELCNGTPVLWDEDMLEKVPKDWIMDVWEALNEMSTIDAELLNEHAGNLCILPTKISEETYLYPLKLAWTVLTKSNRLLQTAISIGDFPVCALQSSMKAARNIVASSDRPRTIVRALHHHQKGKHFAEIFEDDKIIEFFADHILSPTDEEILMLKELPMFETLNSTYVALSKHAHVIPSGIPMLDMDSWRSSSSGFLFLKEKECCQKLYEMLGCNIWDEAKLYVEYIFPQLEMLTDEGRSMHMDYVFDNLQGKKEVMQALSTLECVRNTAGSYCRPCDLYDPNISLFIWMQREDLPAEEYKKSDRLTVLRQAGMVSTASKEMLVGYANRLALEQRSPIHLLLLYPVRYILEYIKTEVATDLQPEYMESLSNIAFIPRKESAHASICPENTTKSKVTLRGSVPEGKADLVWTVAPLISDSYTGFSSEALQAAGVISEPKCILVAQNIKRACEYHRSELTSSGGSHTLAGLIEKCFAYITQRMNEDNLTVLQAEYLKQSLRETLRDCCCVPVQQGQRFVKPRQTVLDARSGEEVQPYLYCLPRNLCPSEKVLVWLGLNEAPTARTYQSVLGMIYEKLRSKPITDREDFDAAKHATLLIFKKVQQGDNTLDPNNDLWLLSSRGCLWRAGDLMYSNNHAMQERLQPDTKVLIDLGIRDSLQSVLDLIPHTHRPKLLTSAVEEVVAHAKSTTDDVPNRLGLHITSELTIDCVKRLARHIILKSADYSQDCLERKLDGIQQSLKNLTVRTVEKLKTCLTTHSSNVVGDWEEKSAFGDKKKSVFYVEARALGSTSNLVYVYKVLADLVNDICGKIFHQHIDVLMVILSEDGQKMTKRLDEMDIRK